MDYWEEMNSKWGFSDGEAVPPDAEQRREVYVTAINRLAERLGSAYRVEAYDRPGMHNWCLILNVAVGKTREDTLQGQERSDAALEEAIEIASLMNLDGYITTTVTVHAAALAGMLDRPLEELKGVLYA